MAVPIWKDHFSNLGAVASQYFRIRVGGNTIYQGRAYRAASSGNLYVRINDICADYMAQTPLGVPASTPAAVTFPMSFIVQKSSDGGTWTSVETVAFNDDWSYDPSFDPSVQGMAFPITGRVDLRQMVYQTRYASGTVTVACNYQGTSRNVTSTTVSTGSTAIAVSLNHAGAQCQSFDVANNATYSGKTLTSFTMGLASYTVTTKCARYVLYYKNPFGGYDHLLIEGNAKKVRSVSRDTFTADYDNTAQRREEWVFQGENSETWTLHTGLLADAESERMPYLLESTDVFFCDLVAPSVFIPAIIVTDSYDVKTYKSNGRQMTDYGFDVRIAQKQYRR